MYSRLEQISEHIKVDGARFLGPGGWRYKRGKENNWNVLIETRGIGINL